MSALTLPEPIAEYFAGTFPGSPIDLKLFFQLERGLIATLEITV